MKSHVIAGLAAAQMIFATQPAAAAGFEETSAVQTGTFAGARIRLSLGGQQHAGKLRAGLTVAPTLRSRTVSGVIRTRFGEGVELGFAGERPLALSLAGRPLNLPQTGGTASAEGKLGMSTGGKIAIGAGVALVIAAAVLYSAAVERDRVSD